MKTNVLTIAISLLVSTTLMAQNDLDALRYSTSNVIGTAKFQGIGGVGGSLGGDMSMLSINPACIGIFKKSEFNFTANLFNGQTSSSYLGTTSTDDKYNFNLSSIGFVGTFKLNPERSNGWESFNIAFGYNKTNNFNNNVLIKGQNTGNTLADQYVSAANGTAYSNLDIYGSGLAFSAGLIDTIPGSKTLFRSNLAAKDMQQIKSIETTGSTGETYLAFGGNYSDKFYLGCSFGFPTVRYIEDATYTETDNKNLDSQIASVKVNDYHMTTGTGFNFKLGMIYRPVDWVRVGGSISTPTFYSMHDEYSTKLTMLLDNNQKIVRNSTDSTGYTNGYYDYTLTTPLKATGSVSFIIGKFGFISTDVEYVDYSTSKLRSTDYQYYDENAAIAQNYKACVNYRIGGELNLAPFAIRAGYGYYSSPYKTGVNDGKRNTYSVGLGYRSNGFYLDFAYVLSKASENYYLYSIVPEAAKNNLTTSSFITTIGFRF